MSDEAELLAGFRRWIELPCVAPREQMWAAREAYAAVLELLTSEPDPADFVGALLRSARDDHELELVCESVVDAIEGRHPQTVHAVFERSNDEPWSTLAAYLFHLDDRPDQSSANLSQIAVVSNWMGARWPGELAEGELGDRYNNAAFSAIVALHHEKTRDPIPLLSALVRACRTDGDYSYLGAGPLEDVLRKRPQHRAAIEDVARSNREWVLALHGVWVDGKTAAELTPWLRDQVIVLDN